ncbi:hypothetical protein Ndes2437B_g02172 [Nannochloris sp. 'desiccata']
MEDAATRRARLKAIKAAAEARMEGSEEPAAEVEAVATASKSVDVEPTLKFRNYAPRDEKIAHEKVEAAKAPEFEEITVDLDAVIGHSAEEVVVNVAPKKANWDLRRDIAPKLAKLERRTQRAMIELMKQEEQHRQATAEAGA